jgi:hypothetical protein
MRPAIFTFAQSSSPWVTGGRKAMRREPFVTDIVPSIGYSFLLSGLSISR